MRFDGRRPKKLTIAFHFQFANQAAWRCDECRKDGLERRRACPLVQIEGRDAGRIVWARREAVAYRCPKALIRPESLRWLEEFSAWKAGGQVNLLRLPARTAEAFFVLEQELRAELNHARNDGEIRTR